MSRLAQFRISDLTHRYDRPSETAMLTEQEPLRPYPQLVPQRSGTADIPATTS
jgi:hypothetical protein